MFEVIDKYFKYYAVFFSSVYSNWRGHVKLAIFVCVCAIE